MISCDVCKRHKEAGQTVYPEGSIMNFSRKTAHNRSDTVTMFRGDLCKECFDEIATLVKASVTEILKTNTEQQ